MADIKLSDIFGGVGGMSDQVIINKNDITQLKTDVNARVKKTGDVMTGRLDLNASTKQLTFVNANNYISISGSKMYIAANNTDGRVILEGKLNPQVRIGATDYEIYHWGNKQADLPVKDIRSTDTTPAYFGDKSVTPWFNNTGLPTTSWYSGITVKGWSTGYSVWELFSHSSTGNSDNKLYFRTGINDKWNSTYEVYHTGRKPQPSELGVYSKGEIDGAFAKKSTETISGIYSFKSGVEPIELYAPAATPNDVRLRGKTNAGVASWYVGTEGNSLTLYSNVHGHGLTLGAGFAQFTNELQARSRLIAVGTHKTPDYHQGAIEVNGNTSDGTACLGFHIPGKSAHSLQLQPDWTGVKVLAQGRNYGNIRAGVFDAVGASTGQGFTYNGKTVIGGVNDGWLRLNPHSTFASGIYCGPTGTLRHDGNIQRGSWGTSGSCVVRLGSDVGWNANGDAAFSFLIANSQGAHWLIASYKDCGAIRSGIQVLSSDTGHMRFLTNLRNNYIDMVGGSLTAQNNVTAYSDIRVKTNIEVIENALEKTLSLRGVTYDRTDQDNVRQTGLIAQEVEKVLPEAVMTTVNGDITDFKSVAYGNLVGLLVESIRELNNKIERLESLIKE